MLDIKPDAILDRLALSPRKVSAGIWPLAAPSAKASARGWPLAATQINRQGHLSMTILKKYI